MSAVDVLIITALKSEFEAAREAGGAGYGENPGVDSWEAYGIKTTTPYLVGTYVLGDGRSMTVALARPTRMGGTATAPVVSSLVERLTPRCLAMSGVCAGNPEVVGLGDVIVAEMAYSYDEGAKSEAEFIGDFRQIPLSDSWVRAAQEMSTSDLPSFCVPSFEEAKIWLLENLYKGKDPREHPARPRYMQGHSWSELLSSLRSQGLVQRDGRTVSLTELGFSVAEDAILTRVDGPERLPFEVKVGPVASGSVVERDGQTWSRLKRGGVRTVLGLEMEVATIAQTAHRLEVPNWIAVKGVMDHADASKEDRYKKFAARASAEVLFKLLSLRLPILDERETKRGSYLYKPSRVRSIYLIGGVSGETEYPEYEAAELSQFCQNLGSAIARAGVELVVCSPFPDSADFHALMGYIQSGAGSAVHLHSPRHPEVLDKVTKIGALLGAEAGMKIRNWHYPQPEGEDSDAWTQAWMLCQIRALDYADAVVAVGGRISRTASTILHLAEIRQKPIVPFEFMGGAARRVFERKRWNEIHPNIDPQNFRNKEHAGEVVAMADLMLTRQITEGHVGNYEWPPRRIFVSRARAEREFARALYDYLDGAGFGTLLGEKEIEKDGRTAEAAIEDSILGSDLFIVLWSKSYAASRYCFDEIQLALDRYHDGELQIWVFNVDGSDVVPPGARSLPQVLTRSPYAVVEVARDLLERAGTLDAK